MSVLDKWILDHYVLFTLEVIHQLESLYLSNWLNARYKHIKSYNSIIWQTFNCNISWNTRPILMLQLTYWSSCVQVSLYFINRELNPLNKPVGSIISTTHFEYVILVQYKKYCKMSSKGLDVNCKYSNE